MDPLLEILDPKEGILLINLMEEITVSLIGKTIMMYMIMTIRKTFIMIMRTNLKTMRMQKIIGMRRSE